jgi:hypothetical protein
MCATAIAADMPQRKSGLWEITIQQGKSSMPPMTMQTCVDQRKDDMTANPLENARKHCPKIDIRRGSGKVVVDTVCTFDRHTAIGHSEITGNLNSEYRMENTTRFDPPMAGMASMSSVISGKWLGPCKPGQKPGEVIMNGMPGGFHMDPEMMKRMQQLREQYGK